MRGDRQLVRAEEVRLALISKSARRGERGIDRIGSGDDRDRSAAIAADLAEGVGSSPPDADASGPAASLPEARRIVRLLNRPLVERLMANGARQEWLDQVERRERGELR